MQLEDYKLAIRHANEAKRFQEAVVDRKFNEAKLMQLILDLIDKLRQCINNETTSLTNSEVIHRSANRTGK